MLYLRVAPLLVLILLVAATFGCSGGSKNPIYPASEPVITPQTVNISQAGQYLMGYYDVYFDYGSRTFEVTENRTASFTLNVVPFLNQMISPTFGITFGSVAVHSDDPTFLGIDVEFEIHHPFPGMPQYDAYDLMGVVIGNGSHYMGYNGLRVGEPGYDLWMNNADGFTRWFNPSDFTTELIFGYAPGGYQNLAGDAQLNPYKYYSRNLDAEDDLWDYLTGGDNFDGIFQSASGRMMELEFPLPPDGIGLMFGYAVVLAWDEQGTGPYYPVHRPEAIALSVSQTPDVWYNSTDGSGGDLILDIDLFGWECQPSTIKLESSVLAGIESFDAASIGVPVADHVSTYHVEVGAKPLETAEGHYTWIIAEYEGLDYSNGLPHIPHADGPLAAFFRYPVEVLDGPGIVAPNVLTIDPDSGIVGTFLSPVTITGEFFEPTCTVLLEYAPGDTIPGENLNWINAETLEIDLDLTGATIGDYDVVVTNPGDLVGILEDGFTVEPSVALTGIDPDHGISGTYIYDVVVTGVNLTDITEVKLVGDYEETTGQNMVIEDSENIIIELDLSGLSLGLYDVVANDPVFGEVTLEDGFEVLDCHSGIQDTFTTYTTSGPYSDLFVAGVMTSGTHAGKIITQWGMPAWALIDVGDPPSNGTPVGFWVNKPSISAMYYDWSWSLDADPVNEVFAFTTFDDDDDSGSWPNTQFDFVKICNQEDGSYVGACDTNCGYAVAQVDIDEYGNVWAVCSNAYYPNFGFTLQRWDYDPAEPAPHYKFIKEWDISAIITGSMVISDIVVLQRYRRLYISHSYGSWGVQIDCWDISGTDPVWLNNSATTTATGFYGTNSFQEVHQRFVDMEVDRTDDVLAGCRILVMFMGRPVSNRTLELRKYNVDLDLLAQESLEFSGVDHWNNFVLDDMHEGRVVTTISGYVGVTNKPSDW